MLYISVYYCCFENKIYILWWYVSLRAKYERNWGWVELILHDKLHLYFLAVHNYSNIGTNQHYESQLAEFCS